MEPPVSYCPVESYEFRGDTCGVTSCMFFEKMDGSCRQPQVKDLQDSDSPPTELNIVQIYPVTIDQLRLSIRDIQHTILLNDFFHFVYQRSILDATRKELLSLLLSEERYQNWPCRLKKPPFRRIAVLVNNLLTSLI
jgi:hypothetical protein